MNAGKWISPQGKIALPLIILAALCLLDQYFNAICYWRLSGYVCVALSCPLGWLAWWLATSAMRVIDASQSAVAPLVELAAAFLGTTLNIYLIACCIKGFSRNPNEKPKTTVGEDELRRLLAEHHKNAE